MRYAEGRLEAWQIVSGGIWRQRQRFVGTARSLGHVPVTSHSQTRENSLMAIGAEHSAKNGNDDSCDDGDKSKASTGQFGTAMYVPV